MRNPIAAWRQQRRNRSDMALLGCLVTGDIYVYDMCRRIGAGSASVYPSLARLERQGIAWSMWVEQPTGPKRRRYGVTKKTLDDRAWEAR